MFNIFPFCFSVLYYLFHSIVILIFQALIPVAFYSVLERKIMASVQRRRGPNVVGFWGSLQAAADGVKLMAKEGIYPRGILFSVYVFAPIFALVVSFTCWIFLPVGSSSVLFDSEIGVLLFFAFSSLGVYSVLLAGWASYSKYAIMGALRAVAQLISYEVVLLLMLFPPALLAGTMSLAGIVEAQSYQGWYVFTCLPTAMMFYVIMLAETNRTPFDLPEAEAELVSGFNVEYSSITFAFFFLAEYCNMILMATLFTTIFLGGWSDSLFLFTLKIILICYSFVFVRALLPRFRYDQLISLCWEVYLPLGLGFATLALGITSSISFSTPVPYSILLEYTHQETLPYINAYFTPKHSGEVFM